MQDFAGKTALAAGSNSGPGKAAAQQAAGRGAHVMPSGPDTARGAAPAAGTRPAEVSEVRSSHSRKSKRVKKGCDRQWARPRP
jgi:NAD(P)-dependent dehydrogenase (short-subunit alcohol dehydrogenase family)